MGSSQSGCFRAEMRRSFGRPGGRRVVCSRVGTKPVDLTLSPQSTASLGWNLVFLGAHVGQLGRLAGSRGIRFEAHHEFPHVRKSCTAGREIFSRL